MTERIGRYELQGVIGTGSFATVHRAHDPVLHGTVVLKVLAENHSLNPEVRERFIAEGRALRKVRSPHVVTVHDLGETDRQQPYLVLEHADRGTVAERVEAHRRAGRAPEVGDVLLVAQQLASALGALHDEQLVHRDLSPANVLITSRGGEVRDDDGAVDPGGLLAPDERLLLADLGLCKDLALNSGLTVAAGTHGFRPPELENGPAVIDTRADVWALAALLEWLGGEALPPPIHEVLRWGRAPAVEDRPATVAALVEAMEDAVDFPRPPSPPAAAVRGSRAAPRGGRHRILTGFAVVGAVLLAGLTGWTVRGDGQPPEATGDASVGVAGPDTLRVGQTGTFTAELTGVDDWVWVLPDGRYRAGDTEVTLHPSSPGVATIALEGRDEAGDPLRATHELRVEE